MFEEQAEKTPDHTAVVFADDKITYRELNERANHLASILREKE
ncbi:AMP-binding protein [Bacillus sonorensis]|nr:AMP-binding protein [Bacillus sonorensis]